MQQRVKRDPPSAVLLAGPTAGGKSQIALDMAPRINGVIVNADSMQVYRELRILTSRPAPDAERVFEHRLYGHVSAEFRYSTGHWLRDIAVALDEISSAGRTAIVVGGTGLYFKALTEGLAAVPPIGDEVKTRVVEMSAGLASPQLHELLTARDPEDAVRIRPSDRARIVRALEVMEATGRSLLSWQMTEASAPLVDLDTAAAIVVAPERSVLHRRISERTARMIADGAIDEVDSLMGMGLAPELPAMKAIGVRELASHRRGDTSLDEAIAAINTETRRYAKRQATWFRNQMGEWPQAPDAAGVLDLIGRAA